jgi:MFS transporter, DHA2 family, multidrug resistance protein
MLSGYAMMPGGFAMLLMMPVAGQVSGRVQPKYLIALGLAGIVLSMWYSTSLTPDATFSYFAWVRVFQTIGLPFLFIPINTVAYDGLPADETNQGSALMNIARNLGGGFGISLANVVLDQRGQFHQSRLVESTIPGTPGYESTLQQITQYFTQHGATAGAAHNLALQYIGQLVGRQATIMAYIDVFELSAIVAAVLIPIVLIMVRHVQIGRRSAAAAH